MVPTLGSVAPHGRAPGSYPGGCRFDACRSHLAEGLPPVRYPVSKTGGRPRLGGSTPSPSASRAEHAGTRALEAWPSWQGSALLPRRRLRSRSQVRVLLPPFPGMTAGSSTGKRLSYKEEAGGSSPSPRIASMRRRPTAGRPVVTRRMLVRAQPSQLTRTRRGVNAGSNPAGEGSIPSVRALVNAAARRSSAVEHHRAKVEDGGSIPPGEILRRRASVGTHRSDAPGRPGSTPGPSTPMPPWSNGR